MLTCILYWLAIKWADNSQEMSRTIQLMEYKTKYTKITLKLLPTKKPKTKNKV